MTRRIQRPDALGRPLWKRELAKHREKVARVKQRKNDDHAASPLSSGAVESFIEKPRPVKQERLL